MHKDGLTMVELLISMAVFGILMAAAFATMTSTGVLTERQTQSARIEASARLAQQRMKEVIQQAHYIYPKGVQLNLTGTYPTPDGMKTIAESGGQLQTGRNALALLVPAGTTYCTATTQTYCLFVYDLDQNNKFPGLIENTNGLTTLGIVEWQVGGLTWAPNTVPATTPALLTIGEMTAGLLLDSVVAGDQNTDLYGVTSSSKKNAVYDSEAKFVIVEADDSAAERTQKLASKNLLISAVHPTFTLEYTRRGKTARKTFTDSYFASAVPRATPVIPTRPDAVAQNGQ